MTIAIIGAGVSGLTTGIVLQEAGYNVEIITRDTTEQTTSAVAAGTWLPGKVEESQRVLEWARVTYNVCKQLAQEPESGVQWTYWIQVWDKMDHDHMPVLDYVDHWEKLDRATVEAYGAHDGVAISVPIMPPPVYLPHLGARFRDAGGTLHADTVERIASLAESYEGIVNCTGVYAGSLTDDTKIHPGRGQVVLVDDPGLGQSFSFIGHSVYYHARGFDCVLGGTLERNVWDLAPDDTTTQNIVDKCSRLEPHLTSARINDVRVGLRPMRETVRLEAEMIGTTPLIHNYGHGGAGYTLSWGCAREVHGLLASNLGRQAE